MKYICVKTRNDDRCYRLFGDYETHADVAREVNGVVVSAGFVSVDEHGQPVAHGSSVSLEVSSDPDVDTKWLRVIWEVHHGRV